MKVHIKQVHEDEIIQSLQKENVNLKSIIKNLTIQLSSLQSEAQHFEEQREYTIQNMDGLNDLICYYSKKLKKQLDARQVSFTYDLEVLLKAKEIYLAAKDDKVKVTHKSSLISALKQIMGEDEAERLAKDEIYFNGIYKTFKKQIKNL